MMYRLAIIFHFVPVVSVKLIVITISIEMSAQHFDLVVVLFILLHRSILDNFHRDEHFVTSIAIVGVFLFARYLILKITSYTSYRLKCFHFISK